MNEIKILNVILNGKPVEGFEGETIYELATRYGYKIPTLCHDPRLEPFSSCFVCVVHVENMRGHQPSCSTKITEGMVIDTESEHVKKARKAALDLLVSNHYADCVAPCKLTCPAGVDVQGYISLIEKGLYSEAVALIKKTNPLPAICGRVCVRPCELACRRNLLEEGAGVGIDYLKRFAADQDLLFSEQHFKPEVAPPTGKKVAIIGGGPGGLSAAYFLQQLGHQCDIYEAAPEVGGWLRYGIPPYRLPNDIIDKEVATITELGVRIFCNKKLGDNLSYKELKDNYDAIILTIGSQKGTLVGVEGDDAQNVFSGIDFLRNMAISNQPYDLTGKTVAVVGGGNTAMDCCRTSVRCGAQKVIVIYRRTEKEMPANPIEIHESKLEGVEYMFLTNPVRINKDENGKVKSVTCIRMELGEPDESGRRRPVPIPGSEFDIEVDYILAAIGQKTDAHFIDHINEYETSGKLKLNKWGDIQCDPITLQTDIPNVFAAGDCVTGPATVIEAINQARIAARSCHRYLMNEPLIQDEFEFISRKDHFKEQRTEDYKPFFKRMLRHEMPVLPPNKRNNFDEVELGYENEEVAKAEASRCLECGCVAYYTCELKKWATEYRAEQKRYSGAYKEYSIDFSHPFIEIDRNKCILCGRCIRICNEVVGANALGFVNRGFDTFIAPAMDKSLKDTTCESCGMCISTCPTAALSENKPFKPGPVIAKSFRTICSFCSIGCSVQYNHISHFILDAQGSEGFINKTGNICRFPRFGYRIFNDAKRIRKPLYKVNGTFREISWDEAFDIIIKQIRSVEPDQNAFFAGGRLTNEELYAIQKFARLAARTNNISSFHYVERGSGYHNNKAPQVPFEQLYQSKFLLLLGTEINKEHGVLSFLIHNARYRNNIPIWLVTTSEKTSIDHKVDEVIRIRSYYAFVKAINHYLISTKRYNLLFINEHTSNFEAYKNYILALNYKQILSEAGIEQDVLECVADKYYEIHESVLLYAEKHVDAYTAREIDALAYLTGKAGKTAAGVIALKELPNSHGLHDMGICPKVGPGAQSLNDEEYVQKIKQIWQLNEIPAVKDQSLIELLKSYRMKNLFIFGEDPLGCAINQQEIEDILFNTPFICVQDVYHTPTTEIATLVLPMQLPFEAGGTYTNTGKVVQTFEPAPIKIIDKSNIEVYSELLQKAGFKGFESLSDVSDEINQLLNGTSKSFSFVITDHSEHRRRFEYGCDSIKRMTEQMFQKLLSN